MNRRERQEACLAQIVKYFRPIDRIPEIGQVVYYWSSDDQVLERWVVCEPRPGTQGITDRSSTTTGIAMEADQLYTTILVRFYVPSYRRKPGDSEIEYNGLLYFAIAGPDAPTTSN